MKMVDSCRLCFQAVGGSSNFIEVRAKSEKEINKRFYHLRCLTPDNDKIFIEDIKKL